MAGKCAKNSERKNTGRLGRGSQRAFPSICTPGTDKGDGGGGIVVLSGRGMLGRESAKRPQLRVNNTGSVRQILEPLDRDFFDGIVVY